MVEILKKISEDVGYLELIEAVRDDTCISKLRSDHPMRNWASSFSQLSLLTEKGPHDI